MERTNPLKKSSTYDLVLIAIFTALTMVATVIIVIPFPSSTGYLNFGDALVFLSGLLLGPWGGFVSGGVGSALADVVLGYTHFAPITLIVKGLEGFTVGYITQQSRFKSHLTFRDLLGLICAALVMLSGYLIAEIPLVGLGFAIAELVSVNLLQVTVGIIIVSIIGPRLRAYINDVNNAAEISDFVGAE